jgi:hypothetical protein
MAGDDIFLLMAWCLHYGTAWGRHGAITHFPRYPPPHSCWEMHLPSRMCRDGDNSSTARQFQVSRHQAPPTRCIRVDRHCCGGILSDPHQTARGARRVECARRGKLTSLPYPCPARGGIIPTWLQIRCRDDQSQPPGTICQFLIII